MVSLDGRAVHPLPDIGHIPLADEILDAWTGALGKDFRSYHNHVHRVIHYCLALRDCDEHERRKIIIAACFHDLGIWSDNTADYLPPSEALATDYLRVHQLDEWIPEVGLMIDTHHKLRKYTDERYPLVEVLRKADLIDLSLGLQRFGLSGAYIKQVKQAFPDMGFHWRLVKLLGQGLRTRPWNPLPIFKW